MTVTVLINNLISYVIAPHHPLLFSSFFLASLLLHHNLLLMTPIASRALWPAIERLLVLVIVIVLGSILHLC